MMTLAAPVPGRMFWEESRHHEDCWACQSSIWIGATVLKMPPWRVYCVPCGNDMIRKAKIKAEINATGDAK